MFLSSFGKIGLFTNILLFQIAMSRATYRVGGIYHHQINTPYNKPLILTLMLSPRRVILHHQALYLGE